MAHKDDKGPAAQKIKPMLFPLSPSLGRASSEERSPFEYLDILYSAQSFGLYKA